MGIWVFIITNRHIISDVMITIGLFINIFGTIYLSKGLLLRDFDINAMTATMPGRNKEFVKYLKRNRDDAKKGFILLGIGFILQIVGLLIGL